MQDLHARMLGALLAGEGLAGVAELAAAEAGRPVAILLPARGMSASSDAGLDLGELAAYAAGLGRGEGAAEPGAVEALEPVVAGGEPIGIVVALRAERNGLPELAVDRAEVLRTAALAAITEVAVSDRAGRGGRGGPRHPARGPAGPERRRARHRSPRRPPGLRSRPRGGGARRRDPLGPAAARRRAHHERTSRCDRGAAPVRGRDGADPAEARVRIYAILPARGGDDAPERTGGSASALASRLRAHGPAAFSSFYANPADLGRAVAEAELMLEVVAVDDRIADHLADGPGRRRLPPPLPRHGDRPRRGAPLLRRHRRAAGRARPRVPHRPPRRPSSPTSRTTAT